MRFALAGLLALLAAAPSASASDIYIGVERGSAPQWRLGLDSFFPEDPKRPGDAKTALEVREVLRSDLLFSRYFELIEREPGSGGPAPEDWKRRGAGFLLEAKVSHIADQVSVSVTVKELTSGQAMLARFYRQGERHVRLLAHKIADDIVRQLTGRRGIARTRIAFVNDSSGSKELFLMDYDGARNSKVTSYKSITLMPRWAPDGRSLAFTSYRDGNPDIFLLDMERGAVRPLWNRQGLNLAGGFAPDGKSLAATVTRGADPQIYIIDLRKGGAKRLTSDRGVESSPTYSPDGEQIAYVTDRSGNPQIYTRELATGRTRRLSRLNWCDSPSWSPTGEWIAFAGRANSKDPFDIYLADITGSRIVQLTHGEGSNEDPAWSPDGRFIAFSSTRDKRRRIYVMDRDGSAPHPLGNVPGNSFTPDWGPAE